MSHGWLSTAQYDTPPVCYVATVKLRSTPDIRRESQIPASYPPPPPYRDIVIRFPPVNTAAAAATPPYSSSIIQNFPTIITKYHSPRLTGWLAGWLPVAGWPSSSQSAAMDKKPQSTPPQRATQTSASTLRKQANKSRTRTHTHPHYHTVIIQSFIPQNFLYFIYLFIFLIALLTSGRHTHTPEPDNPGAAERQKRCDLFFFLVFCLFFPSSFHQKLYICQELQ